MSVQELFSTEYRSTAETRTVGFIAQPTAKVAARKVNLSVQSVLKQEDLILQQLESIDNDEFYSQRVVVPISLFSNCLQK